MKIVFKRIFTVLQYIWQLLKINMDADSCMCTTCRCPQRPEEDSWALRAGVTDRELPDASAGNQTLGLCKSSKCFEHRASLQPCYVEAMCICMYVNAKMFWKIIQKIEKWLLLVGEIMEANKVFPSCLCPFACRSLFFFPTMNMFCMICFCTSKVRVETIS